MFNKKILIIDDTDLMVKIISDILIQAGYEVVSATNGYDGIQKVREEKPDLILLDVVMPDIDGFEVCRILRDDDSNNLTPIIILTAQDNEDDKLSGLELGADDYIIKPFNPRELLGRVRNTLRRIDRNRCANPLTGLHGNIEIQAEINQKIAKKLDFNVIYADIDNFKAFNDVYGYANGDTAIKFTADIISDVVNTVGGQNDFVGHVGGDDFIIITTPKNSEKICKAIISDFDKKIINLYTKDDREKGFIVTENRVGDIMNYPIMTISLAIVSNENREIISHVQVSEFAAEMKRKAKAIKGSVYVKDSRS